MSYFQSKSTAKPQTVAEPRLDTVVSTVSAAAAKPVQDVVSTLGPGMLTTGNIVCTGSMQVYGRILGDIHAARLVICEGAYVDGKIVAQEAVIDGTFKGTIHGNNVKLQATAVVEGEIYNKSLTIEQNAQFEGVARRLDRAVDAPVAKQPVAEAPIALSSAQVVGTSPAHAYANGVSNAERFAV